MKKKEQIIDQQLEKEQRKKEKLSQKDAELDKELMVIENQIKQAEQRLTYSEKSHQEMKSQQDKIQSMIGIRNEELNDMANQLNAVAKQNYEEQKVFTTDTYVTGEVDPEAIALF